MAYTFEGVNSNAPRIQNFGFKGAGWPKGNLYFKK